MALKKLDARLEEMYQFEESSARMCLAIGDLKKGKRIKRELYDEALGHAVRAEQIESLGTLVELFPKIGEKSLQR